MILSSDTEPEDCFGLLSSSLKGIEFTGVCDRNIRRLKNSRDWLFRMRQREANDSLSEIHESSENVSSLNPPFVPLHPQDFGR